jgi:hypothetical protein
MSRRDGHLPDAPDAVEAQRRHVEAVDDPEVVLDVDLVRALGQPGKQNAGQSTGCQLHCRRQGSSAGCADTRILVLSDLGLKEGSSTSARRLSRSIKMEDCTFSWSA